MVTQKGIDLTGQIIDYEYGLLSDIETLQLFSKLVKSDLAWRLQGHYGRAANSLIEAGYIDRNGEILIEMEV